MRKLLFKAFVVALALGVSAFTSKPKAHKLKTGEWYYYNTGNVSMGSITSADYSNLYYTGENPSTACSSGTNVCGGLFVGPAPTLGSHPTASDALSSTDFGLYTGTHGPQ